MQFSVPKKTPKYHYSVRDVQRLQNVYLSSYFIVLDNKNVDHICMGVAYIKRKHGQVNEIRMNYIER